MENACSVSMARTTAFVIGYTSRTMVSQQVYHAFFVLFLTNRSSQSGLLVSLKKWRQVSAMMASSVRRLFGFGLRVSSAVR